MICMTTIHAAAWLIMRTAFGAIETERLLALLYIADREHAARHGDLFSACERRTGPSGPVHAEMADALIEGQDTLHWSECLEVRADGRMIGIPAGGSRYDLDHLSDAVIDTLEDVIDTHGSSDMTALSAWMLANCREWRNDDQSTVITSRQVFRAIGMPGAHDLAERHEDQQRLTRLLHALA